jgi:hypothetical protein
MVLLSEIQKYFSMLAIINKEIIKKSDTTLEDKCD